MAEKTGEDKLEGIIGRFLETYKILSPAEKVKFEIEIAAKVRSLDEKTRNLYGALIDAAKDGRNASEAIAKMQKVT